MGRADKQSLMIVFTFIVLAVLIPVLIKYTGEIPWIAVAVVVLAIQYVFVIPGLCKSYYNIQQVEEGEEKPKAGAWRFIPLVNEFMMFDTSYAKLTAVATVIAGVILLSMFVPSTFLTNIFGLKIGMAWGYNVAAIFIIAAVIVNFIYAFGYCKMLRNVNMVVLDYLNARPGKLEWVYYLLLLLPFVRLCGLITLSEKVRMLEVANYGSAEAVKYVKQ